MRSISILLLFFLALSTELFGGNVVISNVSLSDQNTTNDTYSVNFDISWENSWRTSTFESNHDAVWLFVKFRETPSLDWQHARLLSAGSAAPSGGELELSVDADPTSSVGAFLYRSSDGIGDIEFSNVQLQWNYGPTIDDETVFEICVFAIEMAHIPGGSFVVGDGSTDPRGNLEAGNSGTAFTISSEAALTLGGTSVNNLSNNDGVSMVFIDDFDYSTTQNLPAAYPKGSLPFYCMKYEISQGQYAAFLNKLSPTAAIERYSEQFDQNLHSISNTGAAPEVYVAASPDAANNYMEWADMAAYADWSGLRPMSELEYEKICRGDRPAGPDEYVWGDQFLFNQSYTLNAGGTPSEAITNPGVGTGNAIYSSTDPLADSGPRRCGLSSASLPTPSRAEAGATYYGVMEMAGNVWEMLISLGTPQGREFQENAHGDGILDLNGASSTIGWPATSGPDDGLGIGLRGGGYSNSATDLRTSSRRLAAFPVDARFSDVGGRLVRSTDN